MKIPWYLRGTNQIRGAGLSGRVVLLLIMVVLGGMGFWANLFDLVIAQESATPVGTVTPSLPDTRFPSVSSATVSATASATASVSVPSSVTATATPSVTLPPTPGPDEILEDRIDRIFAGMTVADRVGQLFVVEFQGNRIGPRSDIAELIEEYRVGGVVISPQNRNFSNLGGATPEEVARLTNRLQALAYGIYLSQADALNPFKSVLVIPDNLPFALDQQLPLQLPLLIGVNQRGDGLPETALRAGFTDIPSQMALGATWNPALVEEIAAILGRELHSVGVNLLLGPILDVLEQPRPDLVTGLVTFGGDPFWVGRMGKAYVSGVHRGSAGHVATVAGHFPGLGGTDRRLHEEVATIQKSPQELLRIELPPFAAVTERASGILWSDGDMTATEALMSGHIRFSSFQGGRERTPPISLAQELGILLGLSEFAPWREQGGILMSDALGVMAVRRYYDPTLQEFPGRRIALDAFLAGNDLLYLADFSPASWADARANIKETILFFRERYTSDAGFAARVDESLRRILRLKLRLYASDDSVETRETEDLDRPLMIDMEDVLVRPLDLQTGFRASHQEAAEALLGQVAREALTVFFPESPGLPNPLPAPPGADEDILIFTDSRILRECDDCPAVSAVEYTALEEIMLQFYGPDATGQLQPERVHSRTFDELNSILNGTARPALATRLEEEILNAEWLIFAMLDVDVANFASSDAVKQFLRLRGDRLHGRKFVVIALNEPYFFDSTEISKLTAYLGAYAKSQPFLEESVRALFRAQTVNGAPPVSVPGTRFSNLIERLEPDPNQQIGMTLLNEEIVTEEAEDGRVVITQAGLSIGDSLEIEAGPILDRNGNPVPDGTPVHFRLIYEGDEFALQSEPVATRAGVARKSVLLERPGTLLIAVHSVEAIVSTEIRVRLPDPNVETDSAQISIFNPEPAPLPVLSPPETIAVPTTEAGSTPVMAAPVVEMPPVRVDRITLAIALITQLVVLALLLVVLVRVMPRQMLVYRLLWAMIVGWSAYIFYGVGLIPGGMWLQLNLYPWGSAPVVIIGMLIPLVWLQFRVE